MITKYALIAAALLISSFANASAQKDIPDSICDKESSACREWLRGDVVGGCLHKGCFDEPRRKGGFCDPHMGRVRIGPHTKK